ncbi:glycosyltransferase family 4 protein [Rhodobacter xanthinilyticus]|nr:glycosyltransferase family 1 protein [Rhodobacter xanthinilyticus]
MRAEPAARLLDITRLVSRVGLGPLTGVDRVEMAYLQALCRAPVPLYLLCRTSYGFLLLPGKAAEILLAGLSAPETLPCPAWIDRLRGRFTARARLEAALRARAMARAGHRGLTGLLARNLPQPASYLNVGQTTLRPETLRRLKRVPGLRAGVMIHDTIPLDFPQFANEGEPERFRAALAAAAAQADVLICNSAATAADVARHAPAAAGRCLVAPLGVDLVAPEPAAIPADLDLMPDYFVTLGTIEPRKNHAVLLDAWEEILRRKGPEAAPRLLILGRRGWRNAEVFARLDHLGALKGVVHELAGLSDGAVAALVAGAHALLMPSRAEGFGLPLLEAAGRGTKVIAAPLPVTGELLGNRAIYANPDDSYDWATKIMELAEENRAGHGAVGEKSDRIVIPTWTDHFNLVLNKM